MKLLKSEQIELEDGEVKLSMTPITTAQQARIMDLGARADAVSRIELTRWALKNIIQKIEVSAATFNPAQLADSADLSDTDTMAVMIKISNMVVNAAFPPGEAAKKSPPPPAPGA